MIQGGHQTLFYIVHHYCISHTDHPTVYPKKCQECQLFGFHLTGVPRSISISDVNRDLSSIDHVTSYHNVHLWAITSGRNALSAHLIAGMFTRGCLHALFITGMWVESNRIMSNRVESNRIESNRIESSQIESRPIGSGIELCYWIGKTWFKYWNETEWKWMG